MKTLLMILLWGLLPGVAVAQGVSPQPQGPSVPPPSPELRRAPGQETLRELGAPPCQSERSRGQREAVALPEFDPTTLAVLLANRPERFTGDEWLRMMQEPVNRALFPLHVTQAMLDTLDARKLDLNYQYILIPNEPENHGPRVR